MRLLSLLLLLCPFYLFAQKPAIIETDPNTPSSISNLPFDRPIILKLPVPGKFIESVQLIELRGKQKKEFDLRLPSLKSDDSLTSFLSYYMSQKQYGRLPEIPKSNKFYDYFGITKNGEGKEEFFIRIEALKKYKLDTTKKTQRNTSIPSKGGSKNEQPKTTKQYTYSNNQSTSDSIRINEELSRFYIKPNSKYILLVSKESTLDPIKDSTKFRNSIADAIVTAKFDTIGSKKIDGLYKTIYSLNHKIEVIQIDTNKIDLIKRQIRFIIGAYTDGRKNYYDRLSKLYSDSTLFIVAEKIQSQKTDTLNKVLTGIDLLTKWDAHLQSDELKNIKKIEYLSTNKNAFEKFKFLTDYFSIINSDSVKDLKKWNDDFYKILLNNLKYFREIENLKNEIGAITRSNRLSIALDVKTIVSSSEIFDFDTRTNFAITPEFGYIFVPNLSQGEITGNNPPKEIYPKNFNTPFVGFHVNFRYWDKNLPFWSNPNHKLINHFSWMLGYTLSPMKSKVTESFFNNGRNLITGIGFRLGNAARIVGGVMLYNKLYGSSTITDISKTLETQKTVVQILTEKTGNITSVKETTTTTIERIPVVETKIDEIFPNKTKFGCSFFFGISLDLSPKLLGIESASDLITKIIPRVGAKSSTPR